MHVPSGSNGIANNMGHAPTEGAKGILPSEGVYSLYSLCYPSIPSGANAHPIDKRVGNVMRPKTKICPVFPPPVHAAAAIVHCECICWCVDIPAWHPQQLRLCSHIVVISEFLIPVNFGDSNSHHDLPRFIHLPIS